jgi:predicted ATPase with chaperone activity
VPLENAAEVDVVEGVDVYGASSLSEVVQFLRGDIALEPVRSINGWPEARSAAPIVLLKARSKLFASVSLKQLGE